MTAALQVVANGNSPKNRQLIFDIDPNHADEVAIVFQYEWIISWGKLIRVAFVVDAEEAAVFEQDLPTNGKICGRGGTWCIRGAL